MKSELEKVTKAWPPISRAVRVPHTEADYRDLVELLDRITDEVGEDENHPLASLMAWRAVTLREGGFFPKSSVRTLSFFPSSFCLLTCA